MFRFFVFPTQKEPLLFVIRILKFRLKILCNSVSLRKIFTK